MSPQASIPACAAVEKLQQAAMAAAPMRSCVVLCMKKPRFDQLISSVAWLESPTWVLGRG
jgi:hypothetical protein